jgi:hypothetical protein
MGCLAALDNRTDVRRFYCSDLKLVARKVRKQFTRSDLGSSCRMSFLSG